MNYSILVNSTDSFEDCWVPFFKLFTKYWSIYSGMIYLNTETKGFIFYNLPILCTKVRKGADRNRLTWSQCLLRAFDKIDTDVILYLQDDYFLDDYVQYSKINHFANLMIEDDITYISLVDFANGGPFHPTKYKDLWCIDKRADYRISTQASLWNIKKMRKYIRSHETSWQFEIFGTKRAHRKRDSFYCVDREVYSKNNPIISYKATGIVKGRWNRSVVNLFKENRIVVDYSKRGFYDPDNSNYRKEINLRKIINRIRSYI